METREFQVEVVSRKRTVYRVQAPDAEAARTLATERWQRRESSDVVGFDWRELESVKVSDAPNHTREAQDDELLMRFIRERERLLLRLGGTLLSASVNDAISASQAALDLGWHRHDPASGETIDTVRASEALERLCARKRLVCFERERVRAGERGEIRLYCTPEYLEQLSVTLESSPQHMLS